MTRTTNARVAGFTFFIYIAVALGSMALSDRATGGEQIAASLASIARHASDLRVAFILDLLSCFCALVLAVTLYAITRDQDPDLAMLALTCRVAEGVIGGVDLPRALGRLWLATSAGASAPDPATASALGAVLVKLPSWSSDVAAIFFAVGSTLFAWLLLRGRIVPAALAWLGLLASILAVVALPLRAVGVIGGSITLPMWLPMLAYEVLLGLWLIVKGAAMPSRRAP